MKLEKNYCSMYSRYLTAAAQRDPTVILSPELTRCVFEADERKEKESERTRESEAKWKQHTTSTGCKSEFLRARSIKAFIHS